MGDPSLDWELTVEVARWIGNIRRVVVVTKHWLVLSDKQISTLEASSVVVNTSVSALDSDEEIEHRLQQHRRLVAAKVKAILRIVTVNFGEAMRQLRVVQNRLRAVGQYIDNPLRIPANDKRVIDGWFNVAKTQDLNSKRNISIDNPHCYVGKCCACPDQCGTGLEYSHEKKQKQLLFGGGI
jgi:hypothetical protein